MDLQDPAWKGRWGAPPVGADFQAIVGAMLELDGEAATAAWLAGMKTNAEIYKGNIAMMKAVNAGRDRRRCHLPLLLVRRPGQDRGEQRQHRAALLQATRIPGAFVSVSGGGVLESSKKQQQAQQFLKFITSKAGQEVLEKGTSFEYPVGSDVPANPALVPLDRPAGADRRSVDAQRQKVTDLMTKAGLSVGGSRPGLARPRTAGRGPTRRGRPGRLVAPAVAVAGRRHLHPARLVVVGGVHRVGHGLRP